MELSPYVTNLAREFATLAEAGGEEQRALVERLTGSLESTIRMAMLEVLSAAADEITQDLTPGSVELRLRGREADFVVTPPPADPPERTTDDTTDSPDTEQLIIDDGPTARINVRMPEQLKTAIEQAAAQQGRSVNAWLVRAAAAALQGSDRPEPPGSGMRTRQGFTGWVR
ncbi:Protein of unknown function [Micromonospora nigra]|uniref:Ribbon-helix-helix protein, copG family n=1 Tax=Micromonospora nigra TaxID=145857 RepID=A0A1C6S5T4_9ACTN|nr:DUF1778 domain-containing protein [Micromonospora nigra]SCL24738.1 Protein of unknown function [Micromonospora nigra]